MALLLNDKSSVFGAYGNLNVDTAKYLDRKRGGKKYRFHLTPGPNYDIRYRIFKENASIITYDEIAVVISPIFMYKENKSDLRWSILDDTATISGYKCQKATCDFGNRKWNAWFTMDIPISDGPYKFCGLPGLIVKVNDRQNYWDFTLTSFENKPYEYYEETIRNKDAVSTNKDKFLNLLKSSYDNGFEMEQQYGLTFLNKIEEQKQYYRERAVKENNWIEKRSLKK
jgi:GLPGLI family protein